MEKVKLGDVLLYEQPTKYIVESDRYNDDFEIPVLTAGKSFLLGYTSEKTGIFNDLPVIIFDDFTTAIKFVDFPFKVKSSAMKILKPNKQKADIRYLYYKMLTIKTDSEQHKRYWISKFANIQIPLPKLPEQKAIAAKLDKAQEIISYNQQLIEKYDQLTQSLFIDMFGNPVGNEKGWDLLQIKDVGSSRLGKMLDGKRIIGNNLKPYLRNSNVGWFNFKLDDLLKMDFDENDKVEFSLKNGDVLMCEGGEIGRCAIWRNEIEDCYFQKAIHRIRLNSEYVLPEYFVYMFKNLSDKGGLNEFKSAATISHLTGEKLKKMKLPIPPISLQNQFADRIEKIEAQKQMAQESLAKSEMLFQSLLQESFK
ncbi:restriction endonuclease subunit S [Epilithonimonas sp. JDS]|uniref:restriction endonuclease subunit S n=1 Tax=Epilithonimonas sp. JDS TaxID=2902797 RepID=UPI001E52493B|nr:restriction endonuclease subunit S [Epilithonimonas sp. JDS]MCD9854518.1 restriction endonuclease subunit S [Epilithonimonas sp. JDS]